MVPARLKLIELRRECDEELMERVAAGSHEAFQCMLDVSSTTETGLKT